ncbi:hypothetical protein ACFQ3R_10420 [Mesonia ostreae]
MRCSICAHEIELNYCPNCGQTYKDKRITGISILQDLFGNLFSLEKSFTKNMKVALMKPKELISNYWKGFRGYYYSPSKFLTIASVFVLLHFLLAKDFLGITFTSNVSTHFAFLFMNIALFSLISFVVYKKYKKNYNEHLVLNIYNVSLWSIIFVPISIGLNFIEIRNEYKMAFFILYLLLIFIWNSKVFQMVIFKRVLYITLNFILLFLIVFLLVYYTGSMK